MAIVGGLISRAGRRAAGKNKPTKTAAQRARARSAGTAKKGGARAKAKPKPGGRARGSARKARARTQGSNRGTGRVARRAAQPQTSSQALSSLRPPPGRGPFGNLGQGLQDPRTAAFLRQRLAQMTPEQRAQVFPQSRAGQAAAQSLAGRIAALQAQQPGRGPFGNLAQGLRDPRTQAFLAQRAAQARQAFNPFDAQTTQNLINARVAQQRAQQGLGPGGASLAPQPQPQAQQAAPFQMNNAQLAAIGQIALAGTPMGGAFGPNEGFKPQTRAQPQPQQQNTAPGFPQQPQFTQPPPRPPQQFPQPQGPGNTAPGFPAPQPTRRPAGAFGRELGRNLRGGGSGLG